MVFYRSEALSQSIDTSLLVHELELAINMTFDDDMSFMNTMIQQMGLVARNPDL